MTPGGPPFRRISELCLIVLFMAALWLPLAVRA